MGVCGYGCSLIAVVLAEPELGSFAVFFVGVLGDVEDFGISLQMRMGDVRAIHVRSLRPSERLGKDEIDAPVCAERDTALAVERGADAGADARNDGPLSTRRTGPPHDLAMGRAPDGRRPESRPHSRAASAASAATFTSPPTHSLSRSGSATVLGATAAKSVNDTSLLLLEAMHGITMGTADDLPDSYLVLKSVHDARLAYTFPTVARSLNPCWRVDANERVDGYWHGLSASSVFQVDLYMRSSAEQAKHAPFLLQVSFCVDTSKLVFVGVDLHDIDRPFPANTILFQCADGFFKLDPTKEISRDDSFVLKESYDLDLCDRFLKFHEELGSLRRELKLLSKKLQVTTPRPETSSTSRQILFLRHETKSAVRSMNMEKDRLEILRQELRRRRNRLFYSTFDREQSQQNLLTAQDELFVLDVSARETVKFKRVFERDFILMLKEVYPINVLRDDPSVYFIRRVWLANSEFVGVDEERTATALGWTAHLISLIALYLELPLRYPVNPMCSRSMILDRLPLNNPGSMEFPLFMKGQDKLRFEYGVFLLNKNIEQLLNYIGLTVKNLRKTLPNLKIFLDSLSKSDMLLGTSSHDTKIPACLRVIEGLKKPYQDSSRTMQPDRSMPTPKEGELVEVEFLTHITIPHPKVPHATEPGQLLERNPFGSHSFRQNFLSAGTSLSSSPHSRLSEVPRSLTPFTSETAATKSVAFSSAKGLVTSVLTNNHGPEQNLRFSLASELKSLPRPAGSPSPTPPDDSTSEDDSTSTTSGRSPILPLNSTNGNLPSSSLASRLEQLTADTVRLPLSIDSVKIPSSLSSTESSFESYQTPTNGMSPTRNFLQTTTDIANIFNAGSSEGFSESPRNPSLATRPSMLGLGLFPQSLGNLFFNSFNPTRGMVSDEMEEENSAIDK